LSNGLVCHHQTALFSIINRYTPVARLALFSFIIWPTFRLTKTLRGAAFPNVAFQRPQSLLLPTYLGDFGPKPPE
ncbi:MAG: hypothetical protein WAV74_20870, partial [Anaerolineae bacterium]